MVPSHPDRNSASSSHTEPRLVSRRRTLDPHSNPYLGEFEAAYSAHPGGWMLYELRSGMVRDYAWAVPDEEAIRILVEHSPLVEVGAGLGYWAALIADRGGDVVCYETNPDPSSNGFISDKGPWFDIYVGGPASAADHPDRTLFLCWPPYQDPFAYETLCAYRGDRFIYVGEYVGGSCADDDFFAALEECWEDVYCHWIPRFPGMYDHLTVYRRKR